MFLKLPGWDDGRWRTNGRHVWLNLHGLHRSIQFDEKEWKTSVSILRNKQLSFIQQCDTGRVPTVMDEDIRTAQIFNT